MKDKILILLFQIGFGLTFNLVGVISISELFLLAYSPVLLSNNTLLRKYPIFKKITFLYIGLLVSQIVSEILIGNTLGSSLKGIAVTVVSFLHLIFLLKYFVKDRKLILYALTGFIIRRLIFGSNSEVVSAEEILEGEGATFLKFYVAGIITNLLLIISVLFSKKRQTISAIIIAIGLLIVILGARNAGLTLALAGVISYFILRGKTFKRKQLIITLAITAILGYGLYVVYINQVLEGKITSGNTEQIVLLKNPYNPINLIFTGRTEVLIGWQAFMDSPWVGHGMWATDVTGKYRALFSEFRNDIAVVIVGSGRVIPSHSVLIGAGMYNGIFAFIFTFYILFLFIKTGFKAIDKKDLYLVAVIYSILFILWNGIFSPFPHFKNTLPFYFAVILTSYIFNQRPEIFKNKKYLKAKNRTNFLANQRK